MKREEEEEEVLVCVDEEEARGTDIRPQDLRSVLVGPPAQGWGRHLVVEHLNCSRFSKHVQNIPQKTFTQVLYTCFSICVLLSLLRITYGRFTLSGLVLPGSAGRFGQDCVLLFAMLVAAIVILTMDVKIKRKRRMKDSIPTVSSAVLQV